MWMRTSPPLASFVLPFGNSNCYHQNAEVVLARGFPYAHSVWMLTSPVALFAFAAAGYPMCPVGNVQCANQWSQTYAENVSPPRDGNYNPFPGVQTAQYVGTSGGCQLPSQPGNYPQGTSGGTTSTPSSTQQYATPASTPQYAPAPQTQQYVQQTPQYITPIYYTPVVYYVPAAVPLPGEESVPHSWDDPMYASRIMAESDSADVPVTGVY